MKEFRYEEKNSAKVEKTQDLGMNFSKIKATTLVKCRSARVCPERLKNRDNMAIGKYSTFLWLLIILAIMENI